MSTEPEEPIAPVVPYLMVHDAKAAIAFYEAAFAASADIWPAPDGRVAHAAINTNGGMFYLSDEFPDQAQARSPKTLGGTSCSTVLQVDDADLWWNRAIAAGAEVTHPLANEFYGRYGQLKDPFGHLWGILGPVTGSDTYQ